MLDVGGHPGLLAMAVPHRRCVTIDFPKAGPTPYVCGSGAALPFRDGTFAAVIASDTLEHVPPDQRPAFLSELLRVSSQYVLVGGPYADLPTCWAEEKILELLLPGSQAARWLKEHAEYGLPDRTKTTAYFEENGCRVQVFPGGDLMRWYLLFAAQAVAETVPGAAGSMRDFMPAYNHLFVAPAPSTVPYRHLLLVTKGEWPAGAMGRQEPVSREREELVLQQLESLHQVFRAFHSGLKVLHEDFLRSGGVDAAYVTQLEKALGSAQRAKPTGRRPGMWRRLLGGASRR